MYNLIVVVWIFNLDHTKRDILKMDVFQAKQNSNVFFLFFLSIGVFNCLPSKVGLRVGQNAQKLAEKLVLSDPLYSVDTLLGS